MIFLTGAPVLPPPAASTVRGSQESLWECRSATGNNLDTADGASGGDTPVLLDGPGTNGINGTSEEGRSPVEEAGQEVEVVEEDEELGSTVEEGEEAVLALDVLGSESELPWLQMKHSEKDQDEQTDKTQRFIQSSVPENQTTVVSSPGGWELECPPPL